MEQSPVQTEIAGDATTGSSVTPIVDLEPNRLADAYRHLRPTSHVPKIEKYLDFIDFNNEGHAILGCSNLTGRRWTGSIWYFDKPDAAPDIQQCLVGVEFESGVVDAKFVHPSHKAIILIQDSGSVETIQLQQNEENAYYFTRTGKACEHDDSVSSLDITVDRKLAVTGGVDRTIKIWNIEGLTSSTTYRVAHSHAIQDVKCSIANASLFASCSLDGLVLLWDNRQEKPAHAIYSAIAEKPSCLAWHPTDTFNVVVGVQSGDLLVVDIRSHKAVTGKHNCFTRPVRRMMFANHSPGWLMAVADDSVVRGVNLSLPKPTLMYQDNRHTDVVRDLAWNKVNKKLYSCGWDKQIFTHSIASTENGFMSNATPRMC